MDGIVVRVLVVWQLYNAWRLLVVHIHGTYVVLWTTFRCITCNRHSDGFELAHVPFL